ncbi:MAG: hypothetical protein IPL76_00395 [Gemmatimonadetes bacterium]|nr:hypothetical protein [Gemmatimonadota bacterium]
MMGLILTALAAFWTGGLAGVLVASWCCAAGNADARAERMADASGREPGS